MAVGKLWRGEGEGKRGGLVLERLCKSLNTERGYSGGYSVLTCVKWCNS